jgi:signal transduction histidine kinase
VDEVLGEVLCEQRELLSARRVDVQVHRPLAEVWCNRQRLKQVLTNLLRNAVKHGCDRAQPRVAISTQQRGDRSSGPVARSVVIRLWDNGPGIESRFHEEIFLPGRRLSPSETEGTGMGLAIVKTIVEHYGGTVAVDPNGQGTTFVVQLPSPPEQARRPETGTFATDVGPGIRIGPDPPHEDQRPHRRQVEGQRWRPVRRR